MAGWRMRIMRLGVHIRRHPYLHAVIGFSAGMASFILVDRRESMAGAIALLMLAAWLWLVLAEPIRRVLHNWFGIDLPPALLHFTTQVVHQESFFFVLPFFLITTTWASLQALPTLLICAAALVSIIDPVYARWLAPRHWLYLAYHAFALFVLLLTVLPIVFQLSTQQTYGISTVLALVFAFPSLFRLIPVSGWRGATGVLGIVMSLGVIAWVGRGAVPPATLWLTDGRMTPVVNEVERRAFRGVTHVSRQALLGQGIYAYTAVRAPRGLHEQIYHQWVHGGRTYDRIPVEITGGREAGYRAWTRKEHFPTALHGQWEVRVKTESDQLLGVLEFMVGE